MRALIFSLVLLVSVSVFAQEAAFVKMTQDVTWPDKSVSVAGTVERVLSVTDSDYIVLGLRGAQFSLPKANAVLISAQEAAVTLMAERERKTALIAELFDDIDALEAQVPAQTPAQTPTQRYYARKAARDAKARADAEFAIRAQNANELRRLRQSVDNLRK